VTVPGYTAGSTLHRTGTVYISVAAGAGMLAGMVVAQQGIRHLHRWRRREMPPGGALRKRRKRAGYLVHPL
jgi:hypothetical protein